MRGREEDIPPERRSTSMSHEYSDRRCRGKGMAQRPTVACFVHSKRRSGRKSRMGRPQRTASETRSMRSLVTSCPTRAIGLYCTTAVVSAFNTSFSGWPTWAASSHQARKKPFFQACPGCDAVDHDGRIIRRRTREIIFFPCPDNLQICRSFYNRIEAFKNLAGGIHNFKRQRDKDACMGVG